MAASWKILGLRLGLVEIDFDEERCRCRSCIEDDRNNWSTRRHRLRMESTRDTESTGDPAITVRIVVSKDGEEAC